MTPDAIEKELRQMAAQGVHCASDLLIMATIRDGLRDHAWDFALSAVRDATNGILPEPYVLELKEIAAKRARPARNHRTTLRLWRSVLFLWVWLHTGALRGFVHRCAATAVAQCRPL